MTWVAWRQQRPSMVAAIALLAHRLPDPVQRLADDLLRPRQRAGRLRRLRW